jgi:hypothetical protein
MSCRPNRKRTIYLARPIHPKDAAAQSLFNDFRERLACARVRAYRHRVPKIEFDMMQFEITKSMTYGLIWSRHPADD